MWRVEGRVLAQGAVALCCAIWARMNNCSPNSFSCTLLVRAGHEWDHAGTSDGHCHLPAGLLLGEAVVGHPIAPPTTDLRQTPRIPGPGVCWTVMMKGPGFCKNTIRVRAIRNDMSFRLSSHAPSCAQLSFQLVLLSFPLLPPSLPNGLLHSFKAPDLEIKTIFLQRLLNQLWSNPVKSL